MSFPQEVINDAWRRAGGKCECTRQRPGHVNRRCNKDLDPSNTEAGKRWHAHHIVPQEAGGADTKENCQILCVECHEKTKSYGGF